MTHAFSHARTEVEVFERHALAALSLTPRARTRVAHSRVNDRRPQTPKSSPKP